MTAKEALGQEVFGKLMRLLECAKVTDSEISKVSVEKSYSGQMSEIRIQLGKDTSLYMCLNEMTLGNEKEPIR
jgi:hypothetical protein